MAATAPKMSASGLEPSMPAALVSWGGEPPEEVGSLVEPEPVLESVALAMVLLEPMVDETEAEAEVAVVIRVVVVSTVVLISVEEAVSEAVAEGEAEPEELGSAELPVSVIRSL